MQEDRTVILQVLLLCISNRVMEGGTQSLQPCSCSRKLFVLALAGLPCSAWPCTDWAQCSFSDARLWPECAAMCGEFGAGWPWQGRMGPVTKEVDYGDLGGVLLACTCNLTCRGREHDTCLPARSFLRRRLQTL